MSHTTHVVCPSCLTTNRVPEDKLSAGGTCGKCGKPLFLHKPIELTAANFNKIVGKNELPVMVDFWAPWCGPCRMVAPIVDEIATQYEDQVKVVKLNTDEHPMTASQFGIRSIPTLLVFKGGQKVDTVVGAVPKAALSSTLEKYL